MKHPFTTLLVLVCLGLTPAARASVVINEVMYRPASEPEDPRLEWVELYNPTPTAVDLSGWRLARGVDYAFGEVQLPAGGYLVVAADRTVFLARYVGVTNVVGDWAGKLGNNRQTIELEDAQGEEVDRVEYASEGDWAVRRRGLSDRGTRGWEWFSEADGQGKSLELVNAGMPNEQGQNWGASLVEGGTPGGRNSLATSDGPPLILEARHYPAVPRSDNAVTISAQVLDEQAIGVTVRLWYREATSTTPSEFAAVPMADDGENNDGAAGDGIYGVVLPPLPHLTVVEFYVEAQDVTGNVRTWPAAAAVGADQTGPATQSANALYQVDDELWGGDQPIYRAIMTEEERVIFENINRSSDAEMNVTFVTRDGANEEIRYNCGIRIRGAGSRGRTPPNNRVNIPNDRPWKGLSGINLNTQYTHAQLAGGIFAGLSGLPAAEVWAVQVRLNGQNHARSGSPQYGSYVAIVPIGGEWADRQFPEDGNGNVYRGSRAPWTANLDYRGRNYVTYQNEGYSKASNGSENDWTDLFDLTYALSPNTPDAEYVATVRAHLNVEEALLYFAVCNVLEYSETALCLGVGDDYAMYRGLLDPRFQLVAHDFDTILGEGDTGLGPNSQNFNPQESIWVMVDRPPTTDPAQRATFLERFMRHPEFAPIYYGHLERLLETTFSAAQLEPMLDRALGPWMPQNVIDRMKVFAATRRDSVWSQIPQTLVYTGIVAKASTLVGYRSVWNYLDDGSDLGTAWREPGYDDGAWAAGPAQLGYGDGDEATVVSYGPSSNNKYITTYFRRTFVVSNASAFEQLNLELLRDDGGVVYLNGTEIFRSPNMPTGPIAYDTRSGSGGSDNTVERASVPAGLLVEGVNVLAVEMHQDSANSSDISFDFQLAGVGSVGVSTNGTMSIAGVGNVLTTRSVAVNGAAADWTVWNGVWDATVKLLPGINRVLIQAFDAAGTEVDRTFVDLTFEDGSEEFVAGAVAGETTWRALDGPFHVTGDILVGNGATLIIEPGATVFFEPNTGIRVTGTGRLWAEGTEQRRIRMTLAPTRVGSWRGLELDGAGQESRLAHVDLEFAGAGGQSVRVRNAVLRADDCSFANSAGVYIELENSSFDIRRCVFADNEGAELIHGAGLPPAGYGIIQSNWFGSPVTGLNDVIDFTGGRRPDAILQILDNVFTGGPDDLLELDGTDALIEGNIFMGAHQNHEQAGDTANAIAGGAEGGLSSRLTIVRNLFYDCDHMALCTEGNYYTIVNNTVVGMAIGGVNFSEPERGTAPGAGVLMDGNIFWDMPQLFLNATSAATQVTVTRSILPEPWPGQGNLVTDPRLANLDAATITWQTLRDDFRLLPGSPGLGAGPNGLDMGGLVPGGASIAGEPADPTAVGTATLTVGGPGITHYRWQLNEGAYSVEVPVAGAIQLIGLADGVYTISVVGRNDAGVWQTAEHATRSRTWTVDSTLARLVINEVMALNQTAVPIGSGHPDWVELHNAGAQAVDLSGMGVSDDAEDKFKFRFPAGTTLAAGEHLVLVAANSNGSTGYHYLGFGLSGVGEAVYLHDAGGGLVDAVVFGLQVTDLSIGRGTAGEWGLTQPTPGGANEPARLGEPHQVAINEWLASGRAPFTSDFVELYNRDTLPVPLGGLYLTDNYTGWPARHQVPALSFIPGRGFSLFYADGDESAGADHLGFRLSADQGIIAVLAPDLTVIDSIFYGPQTTDISEGRRPDGAVAIGFLPSPTPGAPNPGPPPVATVTNIVVDLVGMTEHFWRYDTSGTDFGTAWREPGFSDESWALGVGLFGFETSPGNYPYPFNTPVPAPNQAGGQLTVYYRTHFQWTNEGGFQLYATNYIDDGAVFYLNGVEVDRLRINGPVDFNTEADNQPNEGEAEVRVLPTASLVDGDNVLAVEVHQGNLTSSDAVFGMALAAVKSITNTVAIGAVINEVLARNLTLTNQDGSLSDWVELYNPSAEATDLAGMSLSDRSDEPQRFVFGSGQTLPPGAYLMVYFDGSRPAVTSGPGLNTGFGLNADAGDEVYLFEAVAKGGALLDVVSFGIQAGDYSIGRLPNAIGAWHLNQPTPRGPNVGVTLGDAGALRVNEWMADPANGDDWLELFNPGVQPVALGGLHLTDNLGNRTKFRIANLSFIGPSPRGFQVFVADDNTGAGADHVNFRLSAGGEALGLFAADGFQIDSLTFGRQQEGVSEGRFPDGAGAIRRFPGVATPGESNLLPLETIVVSEVLTHTDPPLEDAIELHNPTASAMDVSGWYLTDDADIPDKFRIPDGTVIEALGYAVFYEYQFNPDFSGVTPSFALSSADGDQVYVFPADAGGRLLGYRGGVRFSAAENGVSFGRHRTSVGVDFTALSELTFGTEVTAEDPPAQIDLFRTGTGAHNAYPKVGPVVVSEIHYHPPDLTTPAGPEENTRDEFIELHNLTAAAVPLYDPNHPANTWRLRDAVDFDFPMGTVLPAGGYLLVVGFDPATNAVELALFRARYGIAPAVPILGPYEGRLANDTEEIELKKPDAPVPPGEADAGLVPYVMVDEIRYADSLPWPTLADGSGYSLQKRSMALYGNDPVNWQAGTPTPGGPTGAPATAPPTISGITAPQLVPEGSNVTLVAAVGGPGPQTYQWRLDGVLIPGATASTLTLFGIQEEQAGLYSFLAANPGGAASAETRVDVQVAPHIVQQPQSRTGAAGSNIVFTVTARGSPPLAYQWWFNGGRVQGATQAVLTVPNAQTSNAGDYFVVITNVVGATTSLVATLEIQRPPVIVSQPRSIEVLIGRTASLSVQATGTAPLSYQWYFGNSAMPGRTASTLTLNNVQPVNAGEYSVRIFNSVGNVWSQAATLSVVPAPLVTVAAIDPTASEPAGDPGRFRISRTGSLAQSMEVSFQVLGTAMAGADYEPLGNRLTIPAGQSFGDLEVVVVDNHVLEGDETVFLALLAHPSYDLGVPSTATVTIFDDDNQAPLVAITNLTNGVVFTVPAMIPIQVSARDLDGRITQLEVFYQQTNRIARLTDAPYAITWSNAVAGTYELTAVATDDLGSTGSSVPVSILVNLPPVVGLTSPVNGTIYPSGPTIILAATAADVGGTITKVEFHAGTNRVGTVFEAPYRLDWQEVPDGQYVITARATDNNGSVSVSPPATIWVNLPVGLFADNFADRGTINGDTNYLTGDTTPFTREPNEPRHLDRNGSHSAWLTWVAPASGRCTMDTMGSDFDTVLAVYAQNFSGPLALNNLRLVASDDDSGGYPVSKLTFDAVEGTAYFIAIDGYAGGDYGRLSFHLGLLRWSPVITLQPVSQTADAGTTVSFRVLATGPGPLRYQWWHNGLRLDAATSTTLTLPNVQAAHEGIYLATVSNTSGSTTSAPGTLTLRSLPVIATQPETQVAQPGASATFSVGVGGPGPFNYQWQRNGVNLPGANAASLVLPNVQYTDGGPYAVVVGSGSAAIPSQTAWLLIQPTLVAGRLLAEGQVELTLQCTPGQAYSIEASNDLQTWEEVGTGQAAAVDSTFTVTVPQAAATRFVRVRLVVPVP